VNFRTLELYGCMGNGLVDVCFGRPLMVYFSKKELVMFHRSVILAGICIFLLSGCSGQKDDPIAVEIDEIAVTQDEYEQAFENSPYSKVDDPKAKEEFLDNFIAKKILLKKAEEENLDKDPEFLKHIEMFWQQSLLKLILDKKSKEFSLDIRVSDKEVRKYYAENKDKYFKDKTIEEVYTQIKWALLRGKQQEAMKEWITSLKKSTKIRVNEKVVGA